MVMVKEKMKTFGIVLKKERKLRGFTQGQLAKESGVATSIVNDLENGIRHAGIKSLAKIAKGLGLKEERKLSFLLAGIVFSKRDQVLPDLDNYHPVLYNFLPYSLRRQGISPEEIIDVLPPTTVGAPVEVHLKNGTVISIKIAFKLTPSAKSPTFKGDADGK
jgi:transcriptional regulator with XRE-family HTH domain